MFPLLLICRGNLQSKSYHVSLEFTFLAHSSMPMALIGKWEVLTHSPASLRDTITCTSRLASASCFVVCSHPEGWGFLQGPVGGVNEIIRRWDSKIKAATPWNRAMLSFSIICEKYLLLPSGGSQIHWIVFLAGEVTFFLWKRLFFFHLLSSVP